MKKLLLEAYSNGIATKIKVTDVVAKSAASRWIETVIDEMAHD